MGVTLYKPGRTHTVRGIKCTLQTFKASNYRKQLEAGWFISPEKCYPKTTKVEGAKVNEGKV